MRLYLTSPTPPESTVPAIPPGMPGTSAALEALRAGDLERLDELELAWLNALGPKPLITRDMLSEEWQSGHLEPLAYAVLRGYFADGRSAIEWVMVEPCKRCWHRPTIRAHCKTCGGWGYMNMEGIWQSFYCDTDANVIGSYA